MMDAILDLIRSLLTFQHRTTVGTATGCGHLVGQQDVLQHVLQRLLLLIADVDKAGEEVVPVTHEVSTAQSRR